MTPTLISNLLGKKLVFVTGKGGIGKTLISAAIAQAASASCRDVLVAESAAQDQLAALFGLAPVGHVETIVSPHLQCINLSASGNFREYVTKYLGQKVLFETVFNHRVVKSFFNTIPGLAEIMLLGRLFYSLELSARKKDFIVFDGAASGHFHSLMTTPDAVLNSGLAGPLVKETKRIREFLSDPAKCALLVVATPEDLVIAETLDFLPKLAKVSPVKLAGLVLNRVPPKIDSNLQSNPRALLAEAYVRRKHDSAERARSALKNGLEAMYAAGDLKSEIPIFDVH